MQQNVPIRPPLCYWVIPQRFLAGQHPYGGKKRLMKILDVGIDVFLSLQPAGEWIIEDYSQALYDAASKLNRKVYFFRRPIPDACVCSPDEMLEILDTIDSLLSSGHNLFLHCQAGNGRTGLVVGCWLVRHGLNGEEALHHIEALRSHDKELRMWSSPSTQQQCEMVLRWNSFERGRT